MALLSNIVLIGMPTSGKSTLGRMLAHHYAVPFTDTDDILAHQQGMKLETFLATHGPDVFQKAEEQAVLSLICGQPTVIATGGSVVHSPLAMAHLKGLGRVVYLFLTAEQLQRRMAIAPSRALFIPHGHTWQDVVQERLNLYATYADATIPMDYDTPEQGFAALLRHLSSPSAAI
jgi:shikimate kinase